MMKVDTEIEKTSENQIDIFPCDPSPMGRCIRTIRNNLGMTATQLGKRIGITQQALSQLESKEADYSVTLKTLEKAAKAMGCRLVYALIPEENGTLEAVVQKQAYKKAEKLVHEMYRNLNLDIEKSEHIKEQIEQLAAELAKSRNSSFWDE